MTYIPPVPHFGYPHQNRISPKKASTLRQPPASESHARYRREMAARAANAKAINAYLERVA